MSDDMAGGLYSLRPRARILRTLGEELISSEVVAVIELVKNAYDADASRVEVLFEGEVGSLEALTVLDDGHGMAMDTVARAWMEPATDHKKKLKVSPYLHRRLLGEKGVGRFAAARLARGLELTTRKIGLNSEIYAYFDWTQFDDPDLYLDQVEILAEERVPGLIEAGGVCAGGKAVKGLPRDGTHGTILRMEGLKKLWSDSDFADLSRGLSRLIAPFSTASDFAIFLRRSSADEVVVEEVNSPEIIKYPHYELRASLAGEGRFRASVTIKSTESSIERVGWLGRGKKANELLVLEDVDGPSPPDKGRPLECGPLEVEVLVWDRDQLDNVDQKIGIGLRSVRKDLDSIAGISVYRDGFRVLPYGEPDNDWLKLDLRRVQNPTMRLSNNQITGYVGISSDTNPELRDQSNREGLDNNQAYADLKMVLRFFLSILEPERYRERKLEQGKKPEPNGSIFATPDLSRLRDQIKSGVVGDDAVQILDEVTRDWESQIVRIKDAVARYHTLATVGQLVDKVVHDGRQPLSTIQGQSTLAAEAIASLQKKYVEDAMLSDVLERIVGRLSRVKDSASLLDLLFRRIEPLGGRRKGRPTKVYLNEIIKSAFSHFESDIASNGIRVSLPARDDLVRVDSLELQEVFINLISNSIHWMSAVPKERRAIVVSTSRIEGGAVEIIFADSGPGIPSSNRESIFEPYFSTKSDGVGLGLVISGEIIRDYYGGELELLNAGPLPGAAFRIVIRRRV
ncbi:sensor histidine kinase [Stenotrophomonas rhizophila]